MSRLYTYDLFHLFIIFLFLSFLFFSFLFFSLIVQWKSNKREPICIFFIIYTLFVQIYIYIYIYIHVYHFFPLQSHSHLYSSSFLFSFPNSFILISSSLFISVYTIDRPDDSRLLWIRRELILYLFSQTMAATKRNAAGLTSAVPRATLNDEELVRIRPLTLYLFQPSSSSIAFPI